MPLWIHPHLRTLQEDEEAVEIIQKQNSSEVITALTREAAGVAIKPVVYITRIFLGSVFRH